MSDEYHIRTMQDFLAVPKDRRPAMLADFAEWMNLRDKLRLFVGNGEVAPADEFWWIDDGAVGLSVMKVTIEAEVAES